MQQPTTQRWRFLCLMIILGVGLAGLCWRLIDLNILNRDFLVNQSKARILRTVNIPAFRGMITDRTDAPLAITSTVRAVYINPRVFHPSRLQLIALSHRLTLSPEYIQKRMQLGKGREFMYLKRGVPPATAKSAEKLKIAGLFTQSEYKRFYPEGAVAAHVVGLTNIDDAGQEGLEMAYNDWLSGAPGKKKVLKDRLGNIIQNISLVKAPQQGRKLTLSLDHTLQYLAYRALDAATEKFHAASGSAVILDAKTGEVLAMTNTPSYNPNRRPSDHGGRYRNRAVTDVFEPGSTMKPFTIAFALSSRRYQPSSMIDTHPGWMRVGGYKISDHGEDYGRINVTEVLQKSSNIGAAKIMLSLKPQDFFDCLRRFGFGERTRSGFPGEATGLLVSRVAWQPSVVAALAYGYGIAVTTLQLAHAYQILANDGVKVPVTFLKVTQPAQGIRIIDSTVARAVMQMLQTVVEEGGTGVRAEIPGYRVAGKTGTAYIAGPNGYDKRRYIASFVGVAPATHPRLVVAVVIREPKGQHYGGVVAAPTFATIMRGALRHLNVPPDAVVK